MWCVAGDASFSLHRSMFENKRTGLVGMTVKANLVLCRISTQLAGEETTMRIVTIAAGHQPLVHTVMTGSGKLRLDLQMTLVAQHRLRHGQERAFYFGMVR